MSNLISGLVKNTLRKLGLGGRRRKTVKAEGGRRRRRHAKKGGDEDEKMSFAPMQTRKAGRRHRRR
jgi:hypothetical protein